MPWCPNCKNEYRKGITVCADCGALLVESLAGQNLVHLLSIDQEEAAEKLAEFLQYEGISEEKIQKLPSEAGTEAEEKVRDEIEESEESEPNDLDLMEILVPEEEKTEALRLAKAFFTVEKEKELETLSPEELAALKQAEEESAEESRNVHTYVDAKEKYQENRSAAILFFGFGALGLLFTVCNTVGLLSFFSGWFPLGIAYVLFVSFLLVGVSSLKRSKTLQEAITKEDTQTKEVLDWLASHATEEKLQEAIDPEASEEENDLNRFNLVKELLAAQFPDLDGNYRDHLADRFLGE